MVAALDNVARAVLDQVDERNPHVPVRVARALVPVAGKPHPSHLKNIFSLASSASSSPHDPIQIPSVRHAFQLVFTRVLEDETAPSNKILDGLGDQHL